jgi:hypothetical protein
MQIVHILNAIDAPLIIIEWDRGKLTFQIIITFIDKVHYHI